MQHSKERTTVYTFVFTEQEAEWLRYWVGKSDPLPNTPQNVFLTDLYDALAP